MIKKMLVVMANVASLYSHKPHRGMRSKAVGSTQGAQGVEVAASPQTLAISAVNRYNHEIKKPRQDYAK